MTDAMTDEAGLMCDEELTEEDFRAVEFAYEATVYGWVITAAVAALIMCCTA